MPIWLRVVLLRGFTGIQAIVAYVVLAGTVIGLVLALNGNPYGPFILMASIPASVGFSAIVSLEKRRGQSSL
jgi:hypothetical protein